MTGDWSPAQRRVIARATRILGPEETGEILRKAPNREAAVGALLAAIVSFRFMLERGFGQRPGHPEDGA